MKPGPVQISILALLVVAILLQVTLLVRLPGSGGGANTNVEQLKTVASALQRDALYGPAAEYFERYLEMADLEPEQTANMLYTVGQMYQENLADPEQALALYVRLLELYPDSRIADKARKARVICLQSLGRDYDAQRSMNQLTTTGETDKVAPSASGPIVATVGDKNIHMGDIEERILALPEYMRQQYEDAPGRLELLRSMVLQRLLADAARRQGLTDDDQIRRQVRDFEEQILAQQVYQTEVLAGVTVGPADVETYYQAHLDEFAVPRTVTAAQILCESEEDAIAARKAVEESGSFTETAKELSKDEATRNEGGELGVLREGSDLVPRLGRKPELAGVIFGLSTGETSEPIESEDGWRLFHALEDTPSKQRTLDEVGPQVEAMVRRMRESDATQNYIQRMVKSEKVRLYEQYFPTPKPSSLPNPNGGSDVAPTSGGAVSGS